jgi:cyclophilin family peptidyl-prolyl cis-trans isomerase
MIAILYDETPKHKANFIKLAEQHYYDSLLFHRIIAGFMIQGGDPNSKNAAPGQMLGAGGPGYTVDAEIVPKIMHERGALAAARDDNPKKSSSGSQFYIVDGTKLSEAELKIDGNKFGQAMQQFLQNPANKPVFDSLSVLYQNGDAKGYQDLVLKLKPRVEKETGINTEKEVDPEFLRVYTTIGGTPALDGQYTVFGKVIKGLEVIDKIAAQPKDQHNRPLQDVRMSVTVEKTTRHKIEKDYNYEFPNYQ